MPSEITDPYNNKADAFPNKDVIKAPVVFADLFPITSIQLFALNLISLLVGIYKISLHGSLIV